MASKRAVRKELEALRANSGSSVSGGPVVKGSTTSTGSFLRGDKGGVFSTSRYDQPTMDMMQGQGQAGAAGYEQMNQPWVMELIKTLMQGGAKGLQGLTDQKFNFGPIAEQARTNFAQTTVPSIAERFSSMGTGGSQRSSAFPQLLSQAGSDLEKQLAAMQEQYGLQEKGLNANIFGNMLSGGLNTRGQNMGMYGNQLGIGTQPMWDSGYRQGSPSGISQLFGGLMQGAGKAAGSYLGM